jgi:hypothetical protein
MKGMNLKILALMATIKAMAGWESLGGIRIGNEPSYKNIPHRSQRKKRVIARRKRR